MSISQPESLVAADVRAMAARVAGEVDGDESALLAELAELETLKRAIAARQAVIAVRIDGFMRERAAAAGVPAERRGRGVAEAIAVARRMSPTQGRQVLATAKQVSDLPKMLDAFRAGDLTEYAVSLVVAEASVLEPADRQAFDAQMVATPQMRDLGTKKIARQAQTIALALDEDAAVRRRQQAVEDRHVRLQPTDRGDGMARLIALVPIEDGVAAIEALEAAAATALALGGATTKSQVMADTLIDRAIGGEGVGLTRPVHSVALNLIMTDSALLDHDRTEPATLAGFGPIANDLAIRLIEAATVDAQKVELRRLFTAPESGELVAMDAASRFFPPALVKFVKLRDQVCRTPGCGARIAHIDHVQEFARGGPTTVPNAQGLCRQCNIAKQVIGDQRSMPPRLRGWAPDPTEPDSGLPRADFVFFVDVA